MIAIDKDGEMTVVPFQVRFKFDRKAIQDALTSIKCSYRDTICIYHGKATAHRMIHTVSFQKRCAKKTFVQHLKK